MFKCVKTRDYNVRDLVDSTNRERQGVAEVDVHNENSGDIWSIGLANLRTK